MRSWVVAARDGTPRLSAFIHGVRVGCAAEHVGVFDFGNKNFIIHCGESVLDGVLLDDCWYLCEKGAWAECTVKSVSSKQRSRCVPNPET